MQKESLYTTQTTLSFVDTYSDPRPAGQVIGSQTHGVTRRGIDVEQTISIDNGALRFQPLDMPGWGRAGIAYGPFTRTNGLTFAVSMLNGHNTSQTGHLPEKIIHRMGRWVKGSGAYPPLNRLIQWSKNGHKKTSLRQFKRWYNNRLPGSQPELDENLAVGWFSSEAPLDPLNNGNNFVMHALGAENGELWVRAAGKHLPAIRGVQNIPIYFITVLREQGAAYYAASLPQAYGMATYPQMRPIGIDIMGEEPTVYAGIHQSVLGQIGFRVDSRVYSAQVAPVAAFSNWYGSAHTADGLTGKGTLHQSPTETGRAWTVQTGTFIRTATGLRSESDDSLAVLNASEDTGLLHVLIETGQSIETEVDLIWRFQDIDNYWCFRLGNDQCHLLLKQDGQWTTLASKMKPCLVPNQLFACQILDDGSEFNLSINGRPLLSNQTADGRLNTATGFGLRTSGSDFDIRFRDLEAHARTITIPVELELEQPPFMAAKTVVVADQFQGTPGELTGSTTSTGQHVWRKELGQGIIDIQNDASLKVRASVAQPNPGRTIYTIPWKNPGFAELQARFLPPGNQRGQGEGGRGGFVFWQDPDNYIIVSTWLDDNYGGASIASFFHLHGFEEIYDAVWTNVGKRVYWGNPYRLRVAFDGLVYLAFVDDEPVLYRALTDIYPKTQPLTINRVGLVANWEWGNDTGTIITDFVAKM
ncbi:MAG: nucleotide-binding protein [Anaerolineae bacterium]|nr:nucleotide-binding protein [Anaerolineae bacterium]